MYIYIYIYIERERDTHIIATDANNNDNNNNSNNSNHHRLLQVSHMFKHLTCHITNCMFRSRRGDPKMPLEASKSSKLP